MSANLDTLRKIAEAATQADWYALRVGIRDEKEWVIDSHPTFICSMQIDGERAKFDAEFIATFDPPAVLALLSRLEQAEQAVQRVRAEIESAREAGTKIASRECDGSNASIRDHSRADGYLQVVHYVTRALDCDGLRLADDTLGGDNNG